MTKKTTKKIIALTEKFGCTYGCNDIFGQYPKGGPISMVKFPNAPKGIAYVTLELIKSDSSGNLHNEMKKTCELIAFLRNAVMDNSTEENEFTDEEFTINEIFSLIGNISSKRDITAPYILQFTKENLNILIYDYTDLILGKSNHGLLLVMMLFKTEVDFVKTNGVEALVERMRSKGHFPFFGLNRIPVV